MEGLSSTPAEIVAGINALRAARGFGSASPAAGPERSPWEKLSRLPREVTSYQIFGKSVGDLGKEAAVSGTAGALLRMGLGATAGIAGFTAVPVWGIAAAGGGIMGWVREHCKRTNETWVRMRQEQGIEGVRKLGKGDTLKGFFNPDQKKSITFAILRGASFGGAGNIAGGLLADTPVGQAVKEGFSRVGELKDAIGANFQAQATEVPTSQAAVPTETPTPTATPTSTGTEVPKTATALPPSPTVQPSPTAIPTVTPEPQPPAAVPPPVEVPQVPEATQPPVPPAELPEKIANMPSELSLERSSNPWNVSQEYLKEVLGRTPSNAEILEVTKELSRSSGISVPEWNISGEGFVDHKNLTVGFKLVFDDNVKSVISSIANK